MGKSLLRGMPRARPAASRATAGGYGPRRESGDRTATGKLRLAPRWTAAAAAAFDQTMLQMLQAERTLPADQQAVRYQKDVVARLLLSPVCHRGPSGIQGGLAPHRNSRYRSRVVLS